MFAIYKKELKSYFLSPTGYITIGLFLLIFSLKINKCFPRTNSYAKRT